MEFVFISAAIVAAIVGIVLYLQDRRERRRERARPAQANGGPAQDLGQMAVPFQVRHLGGPVVLEAETTVRRAGEPLESLAEPEERPSHRRSLAGVLVALAMIAALVGGIWYWRQHPPSVAGGATPHGFPLPPRGVALASPPSATDPSCPSYYEIELIGLLGHGDLPPSCR